jgi:hypothetical protein
MQLNGEKINCTNTNPPLLKSFKKVFTNGLEFTEITLS